MKNIYLSIYISLFCTIFSVSSQAQNKGKYLQNKPARSGFRISDSAHYAANSFLVKLKKESKKSFKQSGIEMFKKSVAPDIIILSLERIFKGEADTKGEFDRELYYTVKYKSTLNLEEVLLKINSLSFIEIAEPAKKNESFSMAPNDPLVDTIAMNSPYEWQLKTVHAFKAFEVEKGDTNIVTGISDLGTDYSHEDLLKNMKYNIADPIDGVDNDNDGYIDNYYGWDFGNNDNNPKPDAGPQNYKHGTFVGGCAFMVPDNGLGGAGTGYNCKYLPIKISDSSTAITGGYQSIDYAVLKHLQIINLSWGGQGTYSQIEQDVINHAVANGVMVIAAAGNAKADVIYYPAGYDNVLAVAATDINDTLGTTWSNIVDICAPGIDVISTMGTFFYLNDAGSSFASPTVTGAAALVLSHFPQYNGLQAAEQLRVTADVIDTIPANRKYKGKMGLGRMNMYRALTKTDAVSVRSTLNIIASSATINKIQGRFVNYLSPASGVKVKLTSNSPYITLIDTVFTLPSLGTLDSAKNTASPFTFTFAANAPYNLAIDFTYRFDYGQGYLDYQNFTLSGLNPDFLDLDSNAITASITNNGRIGYVTPGSDGGDGFTYQGYNLQYEMGIMVNTHKNKLSNCVLSADGQSFDNDFSVVRKSEYVNVPFANQYITTMLADNNVDKVGVQVVQRSYEVNGNGLNKTVFLEYRIKNTNASALDSLNFTLYNDWDIPTIATTDANYYTHNKCVWSASSKMSYTYNVSANTFYAGTALLTNDKPIFYALDNAYSPTNTYNGFSDSEKYLVSSNGTVKSTSGLKTSTGGDVSENIGYTLFNVLPGETRVVAFAVMAGDNLADLQASAAAAQAAYKLLKTSPAPVLALNNMICKNTAAVINPANADSIVVYQKAGGTAVYTGRNYVSNLLRADTTFYVTGNDSLFASTAVTTSYLIQHPASAFTANADNNVSGKIDFVSTSNTGIYTWDWYFGDNTTGSGAGLSHVYAVDGMYTVTLVVTDATGCRDTSVSNVTASVATDINQQSLAGHILKIFPNPANDILHFSSDGYVDIEIYDLLGRSIHSLQLTGADDYVTISTKELGEGTYIVKASTEDRQELIKLVITH